MENATRRIPAISVIEKKLAVRATVAEELEQIIEGLDLFRF